MAPVLTCGEGGSTGSQVLGQINQNSADIETLQGYIPTLGALHNLLLDCKSLAVSQEPSAVDTPLQLEYGGAQAVTDVSIAATGAVTFNTAGKYKIDITAQYGRSGASGISLLLFRVLLDGAQAGDSLSAKIDNANHLMPWTGVFILEVTAGQVLTTEIMRDSTGDNSGGVYAVSPAVVGWNDAPCASMKIYRL